MAPVQTDSEPQQMLCTVKGTAGGSAYGRNNVLLEGPNESCGCCVQLTESNTFAHGGYGAVRDGCSLVYLFPSEYMIVLCQLLRVPV